MNKIEVQVFGTCPLEDENYRTKITRLIDEENGKTYDTNMIKWEMTKLAVRGESIKLATRKKKSNLNKIEVLEKKLVDLQKEMVDPIAILHNAAEQVALVKKEIDELWEIRTKGAITRSRANWVHVMGKPTSYFLRLEAHRGNKKCILRLRTETGELLIENNKILEEEKNFFKHYTQRTGSKKEKIIYRNIKIPKLNEQERANLDRMLDLEELDCAVQQLKSNKCPGLDGLPVEFYRCFWERELAES